MVVTVGLRIIMSVDYQPVAGVEGLFLAVESITPEQEQELLDYLNTQSWSGTSDSETSRKYIGFGVNYRYKRGKIEEKGLTIPPILQKICCFLTNGVEGFCPNACLANSYGPVTGIGPHVDKEGFGSIIVGLSLKEGGNMAFTRVDVEGKKERVVVYLPPRSTYIMSGEARRVWKHSVLANKSLQLPDGSRVKKGEDYERISLTFRHITELFG